MKVRVSQSLWDTGAVIFPDGAVEEGIRQAMGEYNYSVSNMEGAPVTLSGLDGAAATTLPATHETMIVQGAAGLTATGRALDRTEAYDLNEATPATLFKWGVETLKEFRKMLSALRTDVRQDAEAERKNELRTSTAAPWGSDTWKIDGKDGEAF